MVEKETHLESEVILASGRAKKATSRLTHETNQFAEEDRVCLSLP